MDAWIRSQLPSLLLGLGPKGLLLWQWLALPVLLAASWYAGRLLSFLTRALLGAAAARARSAWAERFVRGLRVPLALAWGIAVALLLSRGLELSAAGQGFLDGLLGAIGTVALFGALFRFVEVLGDGAKVAPWAAGNPSALSALELAIRGGKALVLALGCVAVLVQLGYPVASVLAGLGIGGLALALAAQKTVENLFGSIALAVDETIRVGDLVQVDSVLGRVEAIGLRSTRIRTVERSVVSIPNGVLAGMRIESLTARDRMRFLCTLSLEHGAAAAQLRELMAGIEALLRGHPKIWPDDLVVSLRQLGKGSIELDVIAWFLVAPDGFAALRSELLLAIKELVERSGASFAFPPALQPAREQK
jgi:MscS family membrane protein